MTIDKTKFQWNLNTILTAITLASVIVSGIAFGVNQTRDIEDLKAWQVQHDRVVETRIAESREIRGQTEVRIKTVEEKATASDRAQDQIAYRVTVLETSLATQQQQQQKLTETLAEISGDLKVIKAFVDQQNASKRVGR
jgi:septal ring factor EnvC (AmiA/AmiB activator)